MPGDRPRDTGSELAAGRAGAGAAGKFRLRGILAGAFGGLVLLGLGLRLGLRFGLGLRLGLGCGLRGAVLEIRGVPARAFQLEPGRADELVEAALAALRAIREWRVAHALHEFLLKSALSAAIFVDWHAASQIGEKHYI